MKIAAQLISKTELKIFIAESTWENTTIPFDEEQVIVELIACFISGRLSFYRRSEKPGPQAAPPLVFCHEKLTLSKFKDELEKIREAELFEVLLSNEWFVLRKEFADAYTIAFRDIYNNRMFFDWLRKTLSIPQAQLLIQGLKEKGRYFTENFAEFKEHKHIDEFASHLLRGWWVEKVKGFEEEELKKGTLKQEDVDSRNPSRYEPISFY